MFYSPLEQFEVFNVLQTSNFLILNFWALGITIPNVLCFFLLIFLINFMLSIFVYQKNNIVPLNWQIIYENIILFVHSLIKENIGYKYINSIIYILYTLFSFLLIANLIGMIPYSFTVTSHLVVTLTLSASLFIGINIIGVLKHGTHMVYLFIPSGAPKPLLPFLFIIEIISYIARVFSLAIRLFANLMSGHTLLKILAGFVWLMIASGGTSFFFGILSNSIIFLITGLEVIIGALQAYVFCMLICLYYNDCIYLH